MALPLRDARCAAPLVPENRVRRWQRGDELLSLGGVPRLRDRGLALGEELLLLKLDSLPRRVAEHNVEAATSKDVRKRQLPVKEAVVLGDAPRGLDEHRGRRRLPLAEREPRCRRGCGFDDGAGGVLGPEEGGAPRVGHELLVLVGLRGQECLPLSLLLLQGGRVRVRGLLHRAYRIA